MGVSPSKRVKSSLSNSPEFDEACTAAFTHCLSLTQHAADGVFPYQLATAADHIFSSSSLLRRRVSSPPSRSDVDAALRSLNLPDDSGPTLGPAHFKQWAVELFAAAVVADVTKTVMVAIPVGVAGIAGVGAVRRSDKRVVGTTIGAFALSIAAGVWLILLGPGV